MSEKMKQVYEKAKRRGLYPILVFLLIGGGAFGHFLYPPAVPKGMTPEETVAQYLAYAKYYRIGAMWSLSFKENYIPGYPGERPVKIIEVKKQEETHTFAEALNSYDEASVLARYQYSFRNGLSEETMFFSLIKLTEDGPWLIYTLGLGP